MKDRYLFKAKRIDNGFAILQILMTDKKSL